MQEGTEVTAEATFPVVTKDKGSIRGNVKYPWGIVKNAVVTVGEKTVVSDSTGVYEISGLDPGIYSLNVQAAFPGYEPSPHNVEVASGETKVVDVYLDFKRTAVEGHVYDLNGNPIAGATLSGVVYGKDLQTTTSDERGYFRFDKVTPGDRFMRVNASGYMGKTLDFTAREDGVTAVEFRLTPASCKILGKVTDKSGRPLRMEMLLQELGVVVQKTHSDAETGRYEFSVLPGIYDVLPLAPMYPPTSWHGSISADTRVDFSFAPATGALKGPARDG